MGLVYSPGQEAGGSNGTLPPAPLTMILMPHKQGRCLGPGSGNTWCPTPGRRQAAAGNGKSDTPERPSFSGEGTLACDSPSPNPRAPLDPSKTLLEGVEVGEEAFVTQII